MSNSEGSAAPASGSNHAIPSFDELAADPEIAALLDFEPVPRKIDVPGGWAPAAQREFIARLAFHGSPAQACRDIDKHRTGANKLKLSPHGASFRAAWDAAAELAFRRRRDLALQAAAASASWCRRRPSGGPGARRRRRRPFPGPARCSTNLAKSRTKPPSASAARMRATACRASCCAAGGCI